MAKKTVNVEEVYAEYQMIMKQIQVCDQQLKQVDMQSQEFMIAIESMNELGNSKSGEEFLSPIASGIFVRGTLIDWSLRKPFGYAGDFKIINDIYENNPDTVGFDRLFDNYFQMSAISIAVRNRKDDFTEADIKFDNIE